MAAKFKGRAKVPLSALKGCPLRPRRVGEIKTKFGSTSNRPVNILSGQSADVTTLRNVDHASAVSLHRKRDEGQLKLPDS